MTVRKRAFGALAAAALVSPLLSFTTAYAAPPDPPAVQNIEAFCAGVATTPNPFTDIAGNTHERAIECAAAAQIARGGPEELPDTAYGPFRNVRRDQMASFIARMIDKADALDCDNSVRALPAFDGNDGFRDVDANNTHYQNIARLEDAGIVLGGPEELANDFYGPDRNVRRDQMASFIARAVRYMTGAELAAGEDYFTDDEASTHEANINRIAAAGITNGFNGDTYGPATSVPRDQMASFIIRTLADLEEKGEIVALNEKCGPDLTGQNIQVTPDNTATITFNNGANSTATATRSYTATGLVPGVEYRISLVDAAFATRSSTATTSASGVRFTTATDTASSTGLSVNTGNPDADIILVNGATPETNQGPNTNEGTSTTSSTVVAVANSSGQITFVIRAGDEEAVFPVVYVNGGGDGSQNAANNTSFRLEVNSSGAAVEAFDLGGTTVFDNTTTATQPNSRG